MKKKILLVDDVGLLLELEKTFFRRDDMALTLAHDGREALDIIKRERPDLVFLDLYMPGMNGDEICRKVKADPKIREIPIVLLPREGQDDDLKLCREAGCDSVILKPINRHHLLETATKILKIKIRAVPRIKARLHIQYGPGESDLLRKSTFNLSTGGVFIETNEIHPKNTPLVVVFELPDLKDGVSCKSRVAWINPPGEIVNPLLPSGMGIEFLDLSLMDLEAIFALVKKEFFSPSW